MRYFSIVAMAIAFFAFCVLSDDVLANQEINPKYSVADEEALNHLTKLADNGDRDAQYQLGIIYLTGNGVQVSKEKALNLIRQSSWKGNTKAQILVAASYNFPEMFDLKLGKQDIPACLHILKRATAEKDKLAPKLLAYGYLFQIPGVKVENDKNGANKLSDKDAKEANKLFENIGLSEKNREELVKNHTFDELFEKELKDAYGITMKDGEVISFDDSNYSG